jgi:uncharacterized protein YjbI with pentapeptide repeats
MTDFTRDEVLQVVEDGRKCAGADLRDIDLGGASLGWAILVRADLRGANLNGADLSGAKYNGDTVWPEGFDPVAAGAVLVD